MGLGDLYERKRYLEGKIWDCHNTIIRLGGFDGNSGQIGKLKKEIQELKDDDANLGKIYMNLDNTVGFLENANGCLDSAEGVLPGFYSGEATTNWIKGLENIESSIERNKEEYC